LELLVPHALTVLQMKLFRSYEEYAAKYENMAQHLASAYKDLASKEAVERGIEVLARTLSSTSSRAEHSRKGLTFQDLLIKVYTARMSRSISDILHSRSSVSANTHYFLAISLNRLQLVMTQFLMRSSRVLLDS